MKPFAKSELIALFIIFIVLIAISAPNFATSIVKSRDQARKDDLGSIFGALSNYYQDFGQFPKSSLDGKIVACKSNNEEPKFDTKGRLIVNLIPCEWGKDSIVDLTPGSSKIYVSPLPRDPDFLTRGTTYMYFSDGVRYQIYGSLENHDWDEYDTNIIARNIMCGKKICNFGRSMGTPLNISIEEYERQLDNLRKEQLKKNDIKK